MAGVDSRLTVGRVMGTEIEYALVWRPHKGERSFSPPEFASKFFNGRADYSIEELGYIQFRKNGARFYDDDTHPEYSTPECRSVKELVAAEKAGELIVANQCKILNEILAKEGYRSEARIYKNNSTGYHKYESWGNHQNYQVSRNVSVDELYKLMPFLISRIIFSGAGIPKRQSDGMFELSDRARYITKVASEATTRNRGIINLRDEPHADKEKYRRFHDITNDSNMSEYTLALTAGATSCVLGLLEQGFCRDISFSDPVSTLHDISNDWKLEKKYETVDGKHYTAIELNRIYLDAVIEHYQNIGEELGDPFYERIVKMWEETLDGLKDDPMSMVGKLDWPTKLEVILKRLSKNKEDWDEMAWVYHMLYHRVWTPGLYYLLCGNGYEGIQMTRICTDDEIRFAMDNPPESTRAFVRSKFISSGKLSSCHWDSFTIKGSDNKTMYFKSGDPRKFKYEKAEQSKSDDVNYSMTGLDYFHS